MQKPRTATRRPDAARPRRTPRPAAIGLAIVLAGCAGAGRGGPGVPPTAGTPPGAQAAATPAAHPTEARQVPGPVEGAVPEAAAQPGSEAEGFARARENARDDGVDVTLTIQLPSARGVAYLIGREGSIWAELTDSLGVLSTASVDVTPVQTAYTIKLKGIPGRESFIDVLTFDSPAATGSIISHGRLPFVPKRGEVNTANVVTNATAHSLKMTPDRLPFIAGTAATKPVTATAKDAFGSVILLNVATPLFRALDTAGSFSVPDATTSTGVSQIEISYDGKMDAEPTWLRVFTSNFTGRPGLGDAITAAAEVLAVPPITLSPPDQVLDLEPGETVRFVPEQGGYRNFGVSVADSNVVDAAIDSSGYLVVTGKNAGISSVKLTGEGGSTVELDCGVTIINIVISSLLGSEFGK